MPRPTTSDSSARELLSRPVTSSTTKNASVRPKAPASRRLYLPPALIATPTGAWEWVWVWVWESPAISGQPPACQLPARDAGAHVRRRARGARARRRGGRTSSARLGGCARSPPFAAAGGRGTPPARTPRRWPRGRRRTAHPPPAGRREGARASGRRGGETARQAARPPPMTPAADASRRRDRGRPLARRIRSVL